MMPPDPTWQMWLTFALIGGAIVLYASERVALEQVSFTLIVLLLLLFQLAPVTDASGQELGARALLAGFAEPALIAMLCLMVVGQGLIRTGALERPIHYLTGAGGRRPLLFTAAALTVVGGLSAFINNTPVVVMFIPLMAALAERLNHAPSRLMMPLSYTAILGGMTTLIGSGTNLLAAGTLAGMGLPAVGFFDFFVPGVLLAGVGLAYVLLVLPRLLPDRAAYTQEYVGDGKQYIAQMRVPPGSSLDGQAAVGGMFPQFGEMTVRLVQRRGNALLPPFEDLVLRPGDIVVVAATRAALTKAVQATPGVLGDQANTADDALLAEVMVSPGSRLIGRNLRQIGFHFHTGCVVLGVQRRSRMLRSSMDDIRMEAGDVLLVHGPREQVRSLRSSRDVLLMEWSAHEVALHRRSRRALLIFAAVVLLAATGLLPIVIAATAGALAMVAAGCLNLHQAIRAVDQRVVFLVAAALAMGTALQATGGAAFLAHLLVDAAAGWGAAVVLSALFILIAGLTNVISNNATAVLFTPIAVSTALELGVAPLPFFYAVIFAANCSFATPIGYQTNLLVLGPGHYRFQDFLRGGIPLIVLLWAVFSLFAPWYYGL